MGCYKTVIFCLIVCFITGVVFATPLHEIDNLSEEQLWNLFNKNEPSFLITWDEFSGIRIEFYTISNFLCTGFVSGKKHFGVALAQKSQSIGLIQKNVSFEITQSIASRAIFIPELTQQFDNTGLSVRFKTDYIEYQIMNGIVFRVKKTKRIKMIENDDYLGYLYVVENSQMSIDSLASVRKFLDTCIKSPR